MSEVTMIAPADCGGSVCVEGVEYQVSRNRVKVPVSAVPVLLSFGFSVADGHAVDVPDDKPVVQPPPPVNNKAVQ